MTRAIIISLCVLSACTQAPVHLAIGPTCPYGTRGCLPAYLPYETDPAWTSERVLADHALCRAVPP